MSFGNRPVAVQPARAEAEVNNVALEKRVKEQFKYTKLPHSASFSAANQNHGKYAVNHAGHAPGKKMGHR